jgi:crotonobetainyl-CoA:carnitine CoA-transferase CaiB-like acyl-CoA transferase
VNTPLQGLRVLDFGANLAGPFGPQMLGDLGAEVVKIEEIGTAARTMGRGSSFAGCQRGKRSLAVDLKTPDGVAIAHRLIERTDVLHHNLRHGVAERLGFDYTTAKRLNARIIYCHTTGWGASGPDAHRPGWDQFGQALGGAEYHSGGCEHGNPPMWYRYGMCDAVNAMHSVIGVLQALYQRDRTGEGQLVETNILNGGMTMSSDLYLTPAGPVERPVLDPQQRGTGPLRRLYRTADGWLMVSCRSDEQWERLAATVGSAELARDPRFATAAQRQAHGEALAAVLEPLLLSRAASEWVAVLDAAGVPVELSSPTYAADMFDDPDAAAAGWIAEYDTPNLGRFKQIGTLVELSGTPGHITGPPPLLGEHTVEILAEVGWDADAASDFKERGVVTYPEE